MTKIYDNKIKAQKNQIKIEKFEDNFINIINSKENLLTNTLLYDSGWVPMRLADNSALLASTNNSYTNPIVLGYKFFADFDKLLLKKSNFKYENLSAEILVNAPTHTINPMIIKQDGADLQLEGGETAPQTLYGNGNHYLSTRVPPREMTAEQLSIYNPSLYKHNSEINIDSLGPWPTQPISVIIESRRYVDREEQYEGMSEPAVFRFISQKEYTMYHFYHITSISASGITGHGLKYTNLHDNFNIEWQNANVPIMKKETEQNITSCTFPENIFISEAEESLDVISTCYTYYIVDFNIGLTVSKYQSYDLTTEEIFPFPLITLTPIDSYTMIADNSYAWIIYGDNKNLSYHMLAGLNYDYGESERPPATYSSFKRQYYYTWDFVPSDKINEYSYFNPRSFPSFITLNDVIYRIKYNNSQTEYLLNTNNKNGLIIEGNFTITAKPDESYNLYQPAEQLYDNIVIPVDPPGEEIITYIDIPQTILGTLHTALFEDFTVRCLIYYNIPPLSGHLKNA